MSDIPNYPRCHACHTPVGYNWKVEQEARARLERELAEARLKHNMYHPFSAMAAAELIKVEQELAAARAEIHRLGGLVFKHKDERDALKAEVERLKVGHTLKPSSRQ